MAKTKTENRRLTLVVPQPLIDRLNSECLFLGIGHRTVIIDEREARSKADFVRVLVNQYIERFRQGLEVPREFEEETGILAFYLDGHSKGAWSAAVRDGAAGNYKDLVPATCGYLVANATYYYCLRQEAYSDDLRIRMQEARDRLRDLGTIDLAIVRELV